MTDDAALHALEEAACASPENLPLRRHLAWQLLDAGRHADAAGHFRAALKLDPGDLEIRTGLAEAFVWQGGYGQALAALEPLLEVLARHPRAALVAARALDGEGDPGAATERYQQAISGDPALRDPQLEARLGLTSAPAAEAEPSPVTRPPARRSQLSFADVAGMEAVQDSLRMKMMEPLRHPDLFAAFGKRAGGAILLYGPPGCGKTHLARAAAGELGASFIPVGIADVLDMYLGRSEQNLHAVFEKARRQRPAVLFFDEVDALASRRSDFRQAAGRQLVNQFLDELDGVDDKANDGVLVLAATNAPWFIDGAFRRHGRAGEMVFVPPPDAAARQGILSILCRGKPQAGIDFAEVAKATAGYSGADLQGLVDRAVEAKLEESMQAGRPVPLSTGDLLAAAAAVQPTSVREWLYQARNYWMHANQSGIWDAMEPWVRSL